MPNDAVRAVAAYADAGTAKDRLRLPELPALEGREACDFDIADPSGGAVCRILGMSCDVTLAADKLLVC
ncbi:MAG: hypothetical protein M0Z98_07465 [Actinomycetales bacterium]|nr:hypothetical protein [Actinomycetales bacterium]